MDNEMLSFIHEIERVDNRLGEVRKILNYRDERKNNPDRYGLGVVVAGGVTEEQHTTRLLDGLFVISKTRKVTKVLIEMKDGENAERFLRKPSECLKVTDRRECSR